MIQRTFGKDTLGLLGFGTMRMPVTESGAVDENQVRDMVDYALAYGASYNPAAVFGDQLGKCSVEYGDGCSKELGICRHRDEAQKR